MNRARVEVVVRHLIRNPVTVVAGLVVLAAVVIAAAVPWLALPDPEAMDFVPYSPPSAEHWFGTDNYGRDLFSRILWGTRVALVVAIGSSALSTLLGIVLGSLSGYHGGLSDAIMSRTFDVFLLIPTFFLVLLIVALFGASLGLTMVAIAMTTWPRSARIMRSQVLTLKTRTYVQAALAAGASAPQVLMRHVVPNGLAPIVTDGTILMGLAILTEAGLSFLGLGDQNTVSWGRMIFEGQRHLRLAPWMSIFPGLSMLLLVGALNLLGDGLNHALNPQLRTRGGAPRHVPPVPPPADEPTVEDPAAPMLDVRGLRLVYRIGRREIRAVDGVSFVLPRGGSLGIVGESGCGKSSLGAALLQVIPANAELTAGEVRFGGRAILLGGRPVAERGRRPRIRDLRWARFSIIFQSAMNALNPVFTVRRQLVSAYRRHRPDATPEAAAARVFEVFDLIGIPRQRIDSYPHELSGGMRQRVMIALALLLEPDMVIADEPTTALDVLIQDQILGEIDALRRRLGVTLILISHDMGTVAETCDRVAVMYAGQIVEIAPTATIFERPAHPYTRALIGALPSLTGARRALASLPGEPCVAAGDVAGCRFAPRCGHATDLCRATTPPSVAVAPDHASLCHFADAMVAAPLPEATA
ncbi:MAG: dipeptide/oligopeptide/nickel ABC transporter permease/ATP-binding protein [Rhodospirillales bacterium]